MCSRSNEYQFDGNMTAIHSPLTFLPVELFEGWLRSNQWIYFHRISFPIAIDLVGSISNRNNMNVSAESKTIRIGDSFNNWIYFIWLIRETMEESHSSETLQSLSFITSSNDSIKGSRTLFAVDIVLIHHSRRRSTNWGTCFSDGKLRIILCLVRVRELQWKTFYGYRNRKYCYIKYEYTNIYDRLRIVIGGK